MERVQLFLLLVFVLSLYYFRVESHGGLSVVSKLKGGSCSTEERDALLSFKRGLFDPDNILSGWIWIIGEDCCTWKGVGCSNTTGHVIKLDFGRSSCYDIPHISSKSLPSLFRLRHLQYLSISCFSFNEWSIPPSIDSLSNLQHLDLSASVFGGVLPPQLGNLTKLRYLDLSFTNVMVDLSLDMWLFRLKHLQHLSLSDVEFKQKNILQMIVSIAGLRYLDLSSSGLEGVIPPQLGNLTNLRYLDLSSSGFDGVIPPQLGNLTNLRYLDLSSSGFDGAIPLQLGNLTNLRYLDLSSSGFDGAIPLQLGNLTNLRYLDLSSSWFDGAIPLQLGNLTNLRFLDLSYNYLVASNLLWISQLSSLKYLHMSSVNLTFATNWYNDIKMLPALSNLYLESCNLQTSPTSHTYFNFSSTITSIDFSSNLLHGSLSNWLGQFKKLNSLDLESNNFTGPISTSFLSLLCNLNELYLGYNNLTKLIDDGSTLKYNQYKIIEMDIKNNQLSGSIPEWVGQMRHLEYLDLSFNQLSGSIPLSFGQLTNLISLDLCFNLLNGSVSNVIFANLSYLYELDLNDNHLNFSMINFNWIPPFQLFYLSLRSCIIGPQFPLWLQNQKSLYYLDLSNSGIAGIIPSWFCNISSQIFYLNLSHNTIRGELPVLLNMVQIQTIDLKSNLLEGHLPYSSDFMNHASFSNNMFSSGIQRYLNANMTSLKALELSHNNLSDEIPDSICQMPSIQLLDLSYNNLSGEIPKCKGSNFSFMNLQFLNLKNNNFLGSIPEWVGNLPELLSLYLSNNNIYGEIPIFKNKSKLIILDMRQNHLTGKIPLWIGERLVSLKILSLRSNNLQGLIPFELSKLEGLQILDLAHNFLSGPLPNFFKFFKPMTVQNRKLDPLIFNHYVKVSNENLRDDSYYNLEFSFADSLMIDTKGLDLEYIDILSLVMTMDLSYNNLTGEVPIELMSLTGLISLNLSGNQFTGQIPNNIGVMQSLLSLDLSKNHFSGEIPTTILNLSGLEYLNLSYNQLSGRIPMGTQLDTFNESSYYGNPELCGKPLRKTCEGDDHDIDNVGSNFHVGDDDNFGLFLSMSLGFAVGLWSVLGTLLFNKSLSRAYFQLYDDITNNIYVYVAIRVNRWFNR